MSGLPFGLERRRALQDGLRASRSAASVDAGALGGRGGAGSSVSGRRDGAVISPRQPLGREFGLRRSRSPRRSPPSVAAFAAWSWSSAPGRGTRIDGPADRRRAPPPSRRRSARPPDAPSAMRCRQVLEEGLRPRPSTPRLRIGVAHARQVLLARLLRRRRGAARSSRRQPLDRGRHDVAHHPRALAAAEDEEPQRVRPAERRIGRLRRREHRGAHRIAGVDQLRLARRPARPSRRGKPVAIGATRGAQQAVGAAHDAVLLVDHGRDAERAPPRGPAARSDSRRSPPRRPASAAGIAGAASSVPRPSMSGRLRHLRHGERPEGVADGISMHLVGRKRAPHGARRARRWRAPPARRAPAARWRAPRPGTDARRCRRPQSRIERSHAHPSRPRLVRSRSHASRSAAAGASARSGSPCRAPATSSDEPP